MVFLFAMIDNLVARKALMIMFIAMQKVWQQLGHVKLHQRCAAFVHLMQVKGKFTNVEIISAKKTGRSHHMHDIFVIPKGCKIAGGDDTLEMKSDMPRQQW
jgi:uncharacterized membrane protein